MVRLYGGDEEKQSNNRIQNILNPLDDRYNDYDLKYEEEKHHLLSYLRGNDFMIVNFEVRGDFGMVLTLSLQVDKEGSFIYAVSSETLSRLSINIF